MSPEPLCAWLEGVLAARLAPPARAWLETARAEVAAGLPHRRFSALLSLASRHARRVPLSPSGEERAAARALRAGFEPERWLLLETLRAALVLARPDLEQPSAVEALEEAFRHADEGELCALYKCLGLLPAPERFAWRGGEGCRSNMRTVFEAVACDSPFPAAVFDPPSWNQLCIKALFVGAPLHRVQGFDARANPELARMALDLCEERRSAGRPVPPELWMCLGAHAGERGRAAIERELEPANHNLPGRRAAVLALARAGAGERLRALAAEGDPALAEALRSALAGACGPDAFGRIALDPA